MWVPASFFFYKQKALHITITILDIIHHYVIFYKKYEASENGFCLGFQVDPTQVGPREGASVCFCPLWVGSNNIGDEIQSRKRVVLSKNRTMNNVQNRDRYVNMSHTYRLY
jgi:hypothetical protein